jgi:hypothetical protein
MKERPILMSAPMVLASLDESKTQTRRIAKGMALAWLDDGFHPDFVASAENRLCPYGLPGDQLWVREAWGLRAYGDDTDWVKGSCTAQDLEDRVITYRADWGPMQDSCHWRPSIHMPRAVSRLSLEITVVRVERLQDISDADCIAEGIQGTRLEDVQVWRDYLHDGKVFLSAKHSYISLWESINGPESWSANPWVWVVSFRKV